MTIEKLLKKLRLLVLANFRKIYEPMKFEYVAR